MSIQITKSSATGSVAGRRTSLTISQKPETKIKATRLDDSVKEIVKEAPAPTKALISDPSNSKKKNDTNVIEVKQDKQLSLSKKDSGESGVVEEENMQSNGHKSQKKIASDNGGDKITGDLEGQKQKADVSKNTGNQKNVEVKKTKGNEESNQKEKKPIKENKNNKVLAPNPEKVIDNKEETINTAKNEKSEETVPNKPSDSNSTVAKEKSKAEDTCLEGKEAEEPKIIVIAESEGNQTPAKDKYNPPSSVNIIQSITNNIDKLNASDEDMECLIVDSEVEVPPQLTPVKISKQKDSPRSSSSYKTTEIPINRTVGASPVLSSRKSILDSKPSTPATEQYFTSSLRTITGRRSLRPLSESAFRSAYRESYRKINTEFDTNTSSMNVTVGSEVPNESISSIFGRGKKRERAAASCTQIGIEFSPKSPKRPRLDISGLLNVVKTPISMLRTRFSQTRIRSSTPNTKALEKEVEDGVENVSVIELDDSIDQKAVDETDAIDEIRIREIKSDEIESNNSGQNSIEKLKEQQLNETAKIVEKKSTCNVM